LATSLNSIPQLQSQLIAEIETGLPIVPEPYAEIASRLGVSESMVIEALQAMQEDGRIKRFGVVVRHRELGYVANAMVVWDVPDESVDEIGQLFGDAPFVTLCYRRPRRPPSWPYNLFTMIHGLNRDHVLEHIGRLRDLVRGTNYPSATLFSGRRFKQRGARYSSSLLNAEPGDKRNTAKERKVPIA